MDWIVLVGIILIAVLAMRLIRRIGPGKYPYQLNERLFSPAERSFYGVLTQAVKNDAVVFGKVRVADILSPSSGLSRSRWQIAFNRISSKHFDFVVCSPSTLSILAVVELDDKSHSRSSRVERDRFLDSACEAASVPLHRFKAAKMYNVGEVRAVLFPPVKEDIDQALPTLEGEGSHSSSADGLLCPKCSSVLVTKVAKRGKHKGAEFLGCSAYPKCKYYRTKDTPE